MHFSKINWSNFTIIVCTTIFFDSIEPAYRVVQFAHDAGHDGRIQIFFPRYFPRPTTDRLSNPHFQWISIGFHGGQRERRAFEAIDRLIKKIVNRVSRRSWWTKNDERKCSGRNGHSRETIKHRRATITFIVRITYRYTSTIV